MALEPITRQEQIIAGKDLKPITRMEMFLKKYGGASLVSPSGKKFKLTVDDNGVLGTTVVKEETAAEGDGAEFFTLAPTALSFRSTAPLSEFSEVQVNGETVDPENYTLEEGSTIVKFLIDYLKTLNVGSYEVAIVSDGEIAKGGFTVVAPELNEYGFYYNQPYSANLPMFGGDTAFFVREDGTYDIITVGKNPDTGEYTMDGNNIVANHPMLGTITCTISYDGTEVFCNELQTAFKLNNSTSLAADEDYIYIYVEDLGGYEVVCIDKTKSKYGAIKTGINGIDTVKLAHSMFAKVVWREDIGGYVIECHTLETFPEIPDTVKIIGDNAFANCQGFDTVKLPVSIESIDAEAFHTCRTITNVTLPDSATSIGNSVFYGCIKLTSITYAGTVAQWNALTKGDEWNISVPATYVQCSDGQVSLV